jgi:predicted nucleic acid-binding protein
MVLRLEGRKMGAAATAAFESMEAGNATVHVPGMALAEILYLSERSRIHASLQDVVRYIESNAGCLECPLSAAVVHAASLIVDVPELHDRLIAAAAYHLDAVLITNDVTLQESQFIETIW